MDLAQRRRDDPARRLIEDSLVKASFPELKVLAAETTTLDDDRIVDTLVRLRTEELQMEINWRNVEAQPTRRASSVDVLEQTRQRFKQAGLDSAYVAINRGAFGAAVLAYGGANPDGEALWRAIVASVPRVTSRLTSNPSPSRMNVKRINASAVVRRHSPFQSERSRFK